MNSDTGLEERREAKRFVSLIRAAKLLNDKGEFVCVIRDVSATGISLRCFHRFPDGELTLGLQNGDTYKLEEVRSNGNDASFSFPGEIDVDKLIVEVSNHPKRRLRIGLNVRARVGKADRKHSAIIHNLSQQGALIETDAIFAIDELIGLEVTECNKIRAKIRWREDGAYGLIFEDILSLSEFAFLVAELQAPELLEGWEKLTPQLSRRSNS